MIFILFSNLPENLTPINTLINKIFKSKRGKHFPFITVLGAIEPNLLGRTLTHEHISLDFEGFHCDPPEDFKPFLNQKLCMENLGYVRQYPYSSLDNVRFYDEEACNAVLKDIELYKKFGGGSIVENSSHGLRRNLDFMVEAAKKTGVHIIAGTGHYVHNLQHEDHLKMSVEQLTDLYFKEIVTGVEVEGVGMVKCGFIGEVGSVYPLHGKHKHPVLYAVFFCSFLNF